MENSVISYNIKMERTLNIYCDFITSYVRNEVQKSEIICSKKNIWFFDSNKM
jgi:hypothetical protein